MIYKKYGAALITLKPLRTDKNIFWRVITAETQTSPAILPLLLHLQICQQLYRL